MIDENEDMMSSGKKESLRGLCCTKFERRVVYIGMQSPAFGMVYVVQHPNESQYSPQLYMHSEIKYHDMNSTLLKSN